MKRISSRLTFVHKRVFPVFWFGFLSLFTLVSILGAIAKPESQFIPLIVMPLFMMGFGYFLFKKMIFDLMDEVHDCGETLLIRNSNQEDHIALTNIVNVSYSQFVNPPRVTLLLRENCRFGNEVSFSPPMFLRPDPFAKSPLIEPKAETRQLILHLMIKCEAGIWSG